MKYPASFTLLFFLLGVAQAQFGFFEQMFGGQQQQQHHQAQNAPSDSGQYRQLYDRSHCDRYLCPDTLGTLDCAPEVHNPLLIHGVFITSLRALPTPLPVCLA